MPTTEYAVSGSMALLLVVLASTAVEARSSPRTVVVNACTMPHSATLAPYWSVRPTALKTFTVGDTITTGSVISKARPSPAAGEVRANTTWCPTGRVRGRGAGFCEIN